MEITNEKKKLSRQSSSFTLRSPSRNAIRLHRIFDLFDKNNDGFITVDELSQALSQLGLEADSNELKSTVESFITPEQTGLGFEDFAALHKALDESFFENGDSECDDGSSPDSDLIEAFKVFDEDKDGFISHFLLIHYFGFRL